MSDFAPWLRNLTTEDAELARLQEFIDAHSREWPYYSNKLSDFFRVVVLARDRTETQLLDTLERYYMLWKTSARADSASGFWANFGPLALFLVGMIATLFLMYQIYAPSLAAAVAEPSHSNALITFLLAFAATSAIVAAAIGILWFDRSDISSGFAKAKDISTVLAGVIGTIMVFYFVSPSATPPAHVLPSVAGAAIPALPAIAGGAASGPSAASAAIPLEPAEPVVQGTPAAAVAGTGPAALSGEPTQAADGTPLDRPAGAAMPVPPLPLTAMSAHRRGRP